MYAPLGATARSRARFLSLCQWRHGRFITAAMFVTVIGEPQSQPEVCSSCDTSILLESSLIQAPSRRYHGGSLSCLVRSLQVTVWEHQTVLGRGTAELLDRLHRGQAGQCSESKPPGA